MAQLVKTPYHTAGEYHLSQLAYRHRPLNGETLIFVASMPIMVIRDRWNGKRRHAVTVDVAIKQASTDRPARSYTNPHESIRRPLLLSLDATEHQPNGNYSGGWDTVRDTIRKYSTEFLIPRKQVSAILATAGRWDDNNWHNGCVHQDKAKWGKSPRYTVRKSTTAPTAAWDRKPVLGPYFEMKTTSQLWQSEGGCLSKPCRACGFRWGNDRLVESLPLDVMAMIVSWFGDDPDYRAPVAPVETCANPLIYPVKVAPDLSFFPDPPAGITATIDADWQIVWKSATGDRWSRFRFSTRDTPPSLWGFDCGYTGQQATLNHLLSRLTIEEAIRLAIGWLS